MLSQLVAPRDEPETTACNGESLVEPAASRRLLVDLSSIIQIETSIYAESESEEMSVSRMHCSENSVCRVALLLLRSAAVSVVAHTSIAVIATISSGGKYPNQPNVAKCDGRRRDRATSATRQSDVRRTAKDSELRCRLASDIAIDFAKNIRLRPLSINETHERGVTSQ